MEDLSTHLLQAAGVLGLLKAPEDPLVLLTDRPVGRLPEVAAFLAQTVMGAAVHSGAAVGVARGASPVVASLAAIRLEASPGVALAEAEASLVAVVVGVAEVVDKIGTVKPRRGSIDPLLFYFLTFIKSERSTPPVKAA